MKRLLVGACFLAALIIGCVNNPQRIAYNTLATIGHGADTAVKAYTDLLLDGKISTNSLPTVVRADEAFWPAYRAALWEVQFNSNVLASSSVLNLYTNLLQTISAAKGH